MTYVPPAASAPPAPVDAPPAPPPPPAETPPPAPAAEPVATPPPIPTAAPEAVAPPTPAPTPIPPPVQTPPPAPAVEQPAAAEQAADPGFEWQQENATMPPQSRPASGVTSFEWPAAEGEKKKKSKGLFIGIAAVLVALLAAVLGFVLLSGGGSGNTAEATPPPPPTPPPAVPQKKDTTPAPSEVTAQSLSLNDEAKAVVATLSFGGGVLGTKSVSAKDANMSDGSGRAEVRQKGIRTGVAKGSVPGVTFRVRRSGDVLGIAVSAKKGAFTKLEARRDGSGTAIAIRLTKKPAPVAKPKAGSPPPPPTSGGTPPPGSNPPPASPPPTSPQPPASPPPPSDRIRRRPPPPPPPPCDRIRC